MWRKKNDLQCIFDTGGMRWDFNERYFCAMSGVVFVVHRLALCGLSLHCSKLISELEWSCRWMLNINSWSCPEFLNTQILSLRRECQGTIARVIKIIWTSLPCSIASEATTHRQQPSNDHQWDCAHNRSKLASEKRNSAQRLAPKAKRYGVRLWSSQSPSPNMFSTKFYDIFISYSPQHIIGWLERECTTGSRNKTIVNFDVFFSLSPNRCCARALTNKQGATACARSTAVVKEFSQFLVNACKIRMQSRMLLSLSLT